jgi:uncharacterized protein YkwD
MDNLPSASPQFDEAKGITTRRGFVASIGSAALGATLGFLTSAERLAGKKRRRKRKHRRRRNGDDSAGAGSGTGGNGTNPGGSGNPNPGGGSPDPGNPGGGTGWPDSEEQAFLSLINAYRAQNGLGALAMQGQLGQAAEAHSQDLADHNRTGHTGSDGSGPQQRIERAGYDWSWWGENVFWGDASAQGAFNWWKNSPTHNANMLSPNFTEIGVGRAYNAASTYDWYWTTDFGSPG